MSTAMTTLPGVMRRNQNDVPALPLLLVGELSYNLTPAMIENRLVQFGFCLDIRAGAFGSTLG